MSHITVYTKPACVQCSATFRALDNAAIVYEKVDITLNSEARDYVMHWDTCKPRSSSPATSTGADSAPTA